jgi:hypothetical protein
MKKLNYKFIGTISLVVLLLLTGFSNAISITKETLHSKTVVQSENKGGYGVVLFMKEDGFEEDYSGSCFKYHYVTPEPGVSTTFWLVIGNIGALDDTYDVTVTPVDDISFIIQNISGKANTDQPDRYEITVAKWDWDYILVTAITQDDIQEVPLGEWSFTVNVRSQNDTNVEDSVTLFVNTTYDVTLDVDVFPSKIPPLRIVPVKIKLTNFGNTPIYLYGPRFVYYAENGEYIFAGYCRGIVDLEPGQSTFIPGFLDGTVTNKYTIVLNCLNYKEEYEYVDGTTVPIKKTKVGSVGKSPLVCLLQFQLLARLLNLQ